MKAVHLNFRERSFINLGWAALISALSFLALLPAVTTSLGLWIGLSLSASSAFIIYVTSKDIFELAIRALYERKANMHTLLALAISTSWLLGLLSIIFPFIFTGGLIHHIIDCSFILGVVNIGRWFREEARTATDNLSKNIDEIYAEYLPRDVNLILNNNPNDTPILTARENIEINDVIEIKSAARIPVDGHLLSKHATINNECLNGESTPKEIHNGDFVAAGSINLSLNPIRIIASCRGNDSKLSQFIEKLKAYQKAPPSLSPLIDAFAKRFALIIISVACLSSCTWALLGFGLMPAFNVFLSVILCACPCALNMAAPFSHKIADSLLLGIHVFIKHPQALEKLEPKYIFFDKTGTLTALTVKLENIYLSDKAHNLEELIQYAASVEDESHPIARAIRSANTKPCVPATRVNNLPAGIVGGKLDDQSIFIGNYDAFIQNKYINCDAKHEEIIKNFHKEGLSTVCIVRQKNDLSVPRLKAIVPIHHEPRTDAKITLDALRIKGIKIMMLTGDDITPSHALGKILDIPIKNIHANLLAEDKEALIEKYKKKGCVVMVGDGINDASALEKSDVGITLHPDDPATTSASIILNGRLSRLLPTLEIAKQTKRNINQNIIWACAFNFISIGCAILGLHNPIIAGFLMSISSIIVIGNAYRLKHQNIPESFQMHKNINTDLEDTIAKRHPQNTPQYHASKQVVNQPEVANSIPFNLTPKKH